MSSVNWYDVLNVEQDCTIEEIKKSYRKLVLKYHPDRPTGNSDLFELINDAYQILGNNKNRESYDEAFLLANSSNTNHKDMKANFTNYHEAVKKSLTNEDKDMAKINFEKGFKDFDAIHNYKRTDDDENKISAKEALEMVEDLKQSRYDEKIEDLPEELFSKDSFDHGKFNEAWEKMNKGPLEMVEHTGNPEAFVSGDMAYSSFQGFDSLYDNTNSEIGLAGENYAPLNLNNSKSGKKITASDVSKMSGVDYYSKHDNLDSDYQKKLEERMNEHLADRKSYDNMNLSDYKNDGSAEPFGGYGIFDKIGLPTSTINWEPEKEKELSEKYNKLLEHRKSE
jgi:curved DNA-binding protein CbpA